ncbi:MAG TPA: hypothetical protein VFK13_05030 [Gemmatimonadaceae bacterium]|nr:hypothetical protein [Gemmatimonadaceae bacterium]
MSDREPQRDDETRVDPSESEELNDEALESVAGGCEVGCSNQDSCMTYISREIKIDIGGPIL